MINHPNCILQYNFEGNANDASSAGNHATNTGVTFVTGKIGQTGYFGGDDYLITTKNIGLAGTTDFTIALWRTQTGTNEYQFITSGAANSLITWYYHGAASLRFEVQIGGGGYILYNFPISGTWHHLALTRRNSVLVMYLNGSVLPYQSGDPTLKESLTDQVLRIGKQYTPYEQYPTGNMDEICVFNIGLSQSDVKRVMNGQSPLERK